MQPMEPGAPPKKSNTVLIIIVVAALAVVLLVGIGVMMSMGAGAAFYMIKKPLPARTTVVAPATPAAPTPS
jgi:flagellar basal body-associated protein FliL